MLSINPQDLSDRDNYKFLIGSIVPRPIAFVTTLSQDGVLNAAPFSFFNIVSSRPPLISISVQRKEAGRMKDTAKHASDRGEFVVHITDSSIIDRVNQTSKNLPPNESEVEYAGLTPIPSTKISVPGLSEPSIRMECQVEKLIPLGGESAEQPACDLLIGKVVQYHIRDALYKDGKIDPHRLDPMSRMAGHDYAKLGELFTLVRPTN